MRQMIALKCALWLALGVVFAGTPANAQGPMPDSSRAKTAAEQATSCERGNAVDCDELGLRHLRGDGVAKDSSKAATYFERACDRGDPYGCYDLGESHRLGDGVPKDLVKAAGYYLRACDGNAAKGCTELAISHDTGAGVPASEAKTALYADRACKLKSTLGCALLGLVYAKGTEGYPRDEKRAESLLSDACLNNARFAQAPDPASRLACPALAKLTGQAACSPIQQSGGVSARYCYDNRNGTPGWVKTVVERVPAATVAPAPVRPSTPETGATMDSAALAFKSGTAAKIAQNFTRAAQLFEQSCNGGFAAGCTELGFLLDRGIGVPQDQMQSTKLYAKACELGNDKGCAFLGVDYFFGTKTLPKNPARAAFFLAKSCDVKNFNTCALLGKLYEKGDGIKQNHSLAVKLFTAGCSNGVKESCYDIGVMHFLGLGVTQDYAEAMRSFKKDCDRGVKFACVGLATGHDQGLGIAANRSEVARLLSPYCQSADQCVELSFVFDSKNSARKLPAFSLAILQYACDRRIAIGCSFAGIHYRNGEGVEKNDIRATELYLRACDLGRASGCHDAATGYAHGRGVPVDNAFARELYKKACDKGNASSCVNLARYYATGDGVEKNYDMALNLLNRAIQLDPNDSDAHHNRSLIEKRRLRLN